MCDTCITGLCRDGVNRSAMLCKIACVRTDAHEYLSGECRLGGRGREGRGGGRIRAAKSGIGVVRLYWISARSKAHCVMEHLVLNAVGNFA